MKVTRRQAEKNRERVLDVAGRLFREKGFDGIGLDGLMKGAGLTHGGFYADLKSKDELAAKSCERTLAELVEGWNKVAGEANGDPLRAIVVVIFPSVTVTIQGTGAFLPPSVPTWHVRVLRSATPSPIIELLTRSIPGRSRAARRKRALQYTPVLSARWWLAPWTILRSQNKYFRLWRHQCKRILNHSPKKLSKPC
jgi:TetR/AcrR family transcriptional regulator, transcriptional repressor for nem operon